jgi:hypothetical protein
MVISRKRVLPGTTLDVSGALWEHSLLEYWYFPTFSSFDETIQFVIPIM